ncbi:sensor histidine kinase [Mucilaginibacter sp.]|uniref:sensor histidine kinase n=1 Tax=Mucilaginibacter sp. TaxID=1882438 RepID=UPI000CB028A0|nr:HAMP domain-containing sensor histidine kinase [Mucilaginibacter sp.]PLW90375.1 MAG: two-component sensor histidine kinase [Mucilaginibacter sp.]HEK21971.1 sensor histidine kinase [Bacteroidota bacterium]
MKLQTKLTLFNTISKLVIVTLFVLLLPGIIESINKNYTDSRLIKQRDKLLDIVHKKGISNYIENGESYGSYLPLKEEYISLDEAEPGLHLDTIKDEKRIIEQDTIDYRILSHTFIAGKKNYLLEIGKSSDTIGETSGPLQSIAFLLLLGMVLLTILADQAYSNYILRPLRIIIRTKLLGKKFPSFTAYKEVKTSTVDFQHLDISIHKMVETIEGAFQKEREFISNASHELMTPISILQSKIENLFEQDDIADDTKLRLLEMQKILNRLKSITKTLLLISQIENHQFLKEDTVTAGSLLQDVYEEISIRLQDKNINLELGVSDDVELINVNKFLLFNLLFNLINNAIKYNRENGKITVTAKWASGQYAISIADTGIGIAEEELPFIFNRFKKLKKSLSQDSFGLGLPIVRSIADFHQIEIQVSSVQGEGSTFTLLLSPGLINATVK